MLRNLIIIVMSLLSLSIVNASEKSERNIKNINMKRVQKSFTKNLTIETFPAAAVEDENRLTAIKPLKNIV